MGLLCRCSIGHPAEASGRRRVYRSLTERPNRYKPFMRKSSQQVNDVCGKQRRINVSALTPAAQDLSYAGRRWRRRQRSERVLIALRLTRGAKFSKIT